jgi:hypothetical protein
MVFRGKEVWKISQEKLVTWIKNQLYPNINLGLFVTESYSSK